MQDHLEVKIVVLALWFVSVYLHELGHALTAFWGGDREIRERGGFSPIRMWFTSPFMSLVLPAIILIFAGFALPGAATPINRSSLRNSGVISLVFLAGPAATLLVVLLLAGSYHLCPAGILRAALAMSIFFMIMSFLLNLLPLPGFDGFGALGAHLPGRMEYWMYRAAIPTMVFVILLLFAVPGAAAVVRDVCARGALLFGVEADDLNFGFDRFRYGLHR